MGLRKSYMFLFSMVLIVIDRSWCRVWAVSRRSQVVSSMQASSQSKMMGASRITITVMYLYTSTHNDSSLNIPQNKLACQCGEPLRTIKHVLFHCPLFTAARRRHLTVSGRPRSFPQLLESRERDQMLLRFLEETRACTVGRVGG